MKIAVLFDGAGLARLGLEQAGHECVGVELDPVAHHLGKLLGSGNCVLGDAREFCLDGFDAVWASPPCQQHSSARTQGEPKGAFADGTLLAWCLAEAQASWATWWVENVASQSPTKNTWGTVWNAAQFAKAPRQNRVRVIGGRHPKPEVFRPFRRHYPGMDLCPCVTATEWKGCASDSRRASRWYGRRLTVEECAWHMGLSRVPKKWRKPLPGYTWAEWQRVIYTALGNGVPVWMARAFGKAAKQ